MRGPLGIALMANEISGTNTIFPCLKESQALVIQFRKGSELLIIPL